MMVLCIEGPDCSGKSTQVKNLTEKLRKMGLNVLSEEIPFKGLLRTIIYKMLVNGKAKKWPIIFQTLHFLNRLYWQTFVYPFKKVDVIVLGRWSLSSLIYGSLEGVPKPLLILFHNLLLKPDMTFVLNGLHKRSRAKDSYEADDELQANVNNMYKNMCLMSKYQPLASVNFPQITGLTQIQNLQDVEFVHNEIMLYLECDDDFQDLLKFKVLQKNVKWYD